jgi:hypothetical protein
MISDGSVLCDDVLGGPLTSPFELRLRVEAWGKPGDRTPSARIVAVTASEPLLSLLAYRNWRGPVVGQVVTQVWEGYAARLFISFGELTPSTYTLPSGRPGRPHGKIELTNMLSESSWVLTLNGRVLADWESRGTKREKSLGRLSGKRLLSLDIDECSRSTVLRFSRGVAITTANIPGSREMRPHWSLRIAEKNWPPVALMGTGYRWRLDNWRLRQDS